MTAPRAQALLQRKLTSLGAYLDELDASLPAVITEYAADSKTRRAVERLGHFARKYPDALQSFITARIPLEAFSQHLLSKQRGEIKTVLTL